MKIISTLLITLGVLLSFETIAQTRWIEDTQMNFKIQVPSNYRTNQFLEGTDKIHAFLSPDQNVSVRVRSFKVQESVSVETIMQLFGQSIISGSSVLINQDYTLNGLNGKLAGYRWRYNNINVIIAAFFTIQESIGYVVWAMLPEHLYSARVAEADAITNTFNILTRINNKPQESIKSPPYSFKPIVSEDALIEHLIPESSKITSSEAGTSIWDIVTPNGSKATMVIQNIIKESDFKTFTNNQIKFLRDRGAAIGGMSYEKINGLETFIYNYDYQGNSFYYTATDVPSSYYLVGFVGSSNKKGELSQIQSSVLKSFKQKAAGNQISSLKINNLNIGSEITQGLSIVNPSDAIAKSAEKIHLIAEYSGDAGTENFLVKWISITHNTLVIEDYYLPTINGSKKIHAFIENNRQEWPQGKYRAEIWHGGNLLVQKGFSISSTLSANTASASTSSANVGSSNVGSIKQIVMDNRWYAYDFETGKLRDNHSPEPDVMNRPWCTPLPALTGNWAKTGIKDFNKVTTPPTTGYLSDGKDFIDCAEAPLNEVLVFKLTNGKYAKLMIIKDEKTQNASGCEHRVTCLVQYPAF